jgi:membrane protein
MEVEVHVFGFSIAANVLLSFFPFLLVMVWFFRSLGWNSGEQALYFAMQDYFGPEVVRQIRAGVDWIPHRFQHFSFTSIFLLLFTANGVFEPLEVAFNRAWGIRKNRSFFKNQLISLGLIFACGSLALLSVILTAMNRDFYSGFDHPLVSWLGPLSLKLIAVPISMTGLFLIYWLLPNTKIDPKRVIPIAVAVGLVLEAFKYFLKWIWPWLLRKLQIEYGPFYWAVIIVVLSFFASMIVLAGAEWAGRPAPPPVEI